MKVRITTSQLVHFDQEVEMTREEFDTINNLEDMDITSLRQCNIYGIIENKVDTSDPVDWDHEFLDVELTEIVKI